MKIRTLALLATFVSAALNAATLNPSQLAIYYSFDAATLPPPALFAEMQSELSRILAPAGLHVAWRASDSPRNGTEDFPEVVVVRLQGTCFFDGAPHDDFTRDPAGLPLARTELMDGRILPFASVNCDLVRRFIAPLEKFPDAEHRNAALGRALARVIAHEVYHMLTGSQDHASRGIERSAHSRTDLTEPSFGFAATEVNWLRSWVAKRMPSAPSPPAGEPPATAALSSGQQSGELEDSGSAGR